MLILKQNLSNTVPTPPIGKGTIFLNEADAIAVKTSDGNIQVFPTVGGANTEVFYNSDGGLEGSPNFTWNNTTSTLTVSTGNVVATGIKTDNLYYANGTAWDLQQPAGQTSQIQFNDANSFGASSNFAWNNSTNTLSVIGTSNVSGNLNVTSTVSAGNVSATGIVGTTLAGNLTTPAQPNITTVGTLISLTVTGKVTAGQLQGEGGNISNIQGANISGTVASATTASTVTTAAQPNITSVGALTSLSVSGNANIGNIGANNAVFTSVSGNGAGLSAITGSNVSGQVSFAATANAVAGANVSGQVANALVAGTVYTNAQPNITSIGTLSALSVTGNANVGNIGATNGTFTNISGNGSGLNAIAGANVTGTVANASFATNAGTATTASTVTTNAQPNITSIGTLTSLGVTGNVAAGNLTTVGVLSVTGTGVSSIAGNLDMTNNTIINLATPTNANDAATKQYVDDVAQGLHTHDSCNAATNTTLAVISGGTITYNNGSSGVGATLTTTGSYTTIDGVTLSNGMRILVKDEANAAFNGIYDRTSTTVLTRSSDFDTTAEMAGGDFTFVTAGTLYDNTGWVMTDVITTVGTTPVNWSQFSGAGTYTAGTGLTLTGSQFSISNTAVTAGSYGNGDRIATFTVNGQGQLTAAANVAITANASNLSGTALNSAIVTSSLTSVGTLGTLSVTGNANVGNIGATTAIFTTGNITTINSGLLQNGNSNVTITTNGNVTLNAVGAARIIATSVGANVTGTLGVSGNANVGNLGAATAVITTGNITTINSGLLQNGTSKITVNSGGSVILTNDGTDRITATTTGASIAGRITATGNISGTQLISTIAAGTAPLVVTSTTRVSNLNVEYANVADNINVALGTGDNFLIFANAATGNVSELTSTGLTANLSNNSITATTFFGTLSGTAIRAGTVTTNAQPNITSVGTLTSLGVTGNINAGNIIADLFVGSYSGNGAGLTNITGANVTGTVPSATTAVRAGTVTTNAQPNITSVGTLSSLDITGNLSAGNIIAGLFLGSYSGNGAGLTNITGANVTGTVPSATTAVRAGTVTTNAQPNITSVGTLTSLDITGNLAAGNIIADLFVGSYSGNGAGLTNIPAANISGTVPSATTAVRAGTVTTNAQPNITSVGTLTSLDITGNLAAGNVYANSGTIGASLLTGTLTTAAQPNITSVGALTTLSVSGNAIITGNLTINGNVTYVNTETLEVEDPIIDLGTGPNGAAPIANSGKDVGTSLNYYDTAARTAFMGWDVSNDEFGLASVASITNEVVTFSTYGNLRVGNIIGNGQSLSGLVGANVTGTVANATFSTSAGTAGTVTTAAQPNITSVGTLTSLNSSGTITAPAFTANTGVFTGNGSGLTAIAGANVTGTVANAAFATNAGSATTAGTVTTAAQPNITSVGTLTGLTLSGTLSGAVQIGTGAATHFGTTLTTGANTTAGTITGNWSLSAGSRLTATYADIAEKYVADATYEPGTVLFFGGEQEVTLSNASDSTKVAGVVTTNPAYSMNSALEAEYVAEIALQGRVPCKVMGSVEKGDLMVSASNGHAVANNEARAGTIIGKSLENFTGESGVIEVAVGRF